MSSLSVVETSGGKGLQGGVGLEGNANAGENAEAVEEGGIEREAQVGEGRSCGGLWGSPAASIPAAAVEASESGEDRSSTVTRMPR